MSQKVQKTKLTPMEKHFLRWYENRNRTFSSKIHRWLFPNCKGCESDSKLYKELIERK